MSKYRCKNKAVKISAHHKNGSQKEKEKNSENYERNVPKNLTVS